MQLEGEIHEIDLIASLVELGREGFTGAIRFERESIIKIVYFKDGEILSSSTNDRADTIDEILVNAKKINRDHVKQALARRQETETLGDALLALGFITRKELSWARRVQIVGILRSVANWDSGSFQIVPDYLPKREEGTRFPLAQIVIELIVTETDRARVERLLPSTALISRGPDFESRYAELGLNEEADEIVAHVSGEKSVAEIAAESRSDSFAVFKLLLALATLGVLRGTGLPQPSLEVSGSTTEFDFDDPVEESESELDFTSDSSVPAEDLYGEPEPVVAPPTPPTPPTPYSTTNSITNSEGNDDFKTPVGKLDFDPALLSDEPTVAAAESVAIPPATNSYIRSKTFAAPPKKRSKLPVILLAVIILAAAGYAAWTYLSREDPVAVAVASPAASRRPVETPSTPPNEAAQQAASVPATTTTATNLPATTTPTETAIAPATAKESAASGPAAPPAAPAASASAPASGYAAQAREFARAADRNQYALQFEVVCQDASVRRALTEGGPDVWFVPARVGSRDCFRVLWGRFPSREAAGRASGAIPRSLRSSTPIPVAVSKVVP